jgi:hypothetical protein
MYNGFGAYPADDMDMGVNSYFGESDTNFFGDTSNDSFFGEGAGFAFDSSNSFFGESTECFVESDDNNKKGKWDGKFSDDPELNAAKAKMDHYDLDDENGEKPFSITRDSTRKASNRLQRLNYTNSDEFADDVRESAAGASLGFHSKKGTPYSDGVSSEEFYRDLKGIWKRGDAIKEVKKKGNKK